MLNPTSPIEHAAALVFGDQAKHPSGTTPLLARWNAAVGSAAAAALGLELGATVAGVAAAGPPAGVVVTVGTLLSGGAGSHAGPARTAIKRDAETAARGDRYGEGVRMAGRDRQR
jgi:hypothetical protein